MIQLWKVFLLYSHLLFPVSSTTFKSGGPPEYKRYHYSYNMQNRIFYCSKAVTFSKESRLNEFEMTHGLFHTNSLKLIVTSLRATGHTKSHKTTSFLWLYQFCSPFNITFFSFIQQSNIKLFSSCINLLSLYLCNFWSFHKLLAGGLLTLSVCSQTRLYTKIISLVYWSVNTA